VANVSDGITFNGRLCQLLTEAASADITETGNTLGTTNILQAVIFGTKNCNRSPKYGPRSMNVCTFKEKKQC
jgi:hypothetical protein